MCPDTTSAYALYNSDVDVMPNIQFLFEFNLLYSLILACCIKCSEFQYLSNTFIKLGLYEGDVQPHPLPRNSRKLDIKLVLIDDSSFKLPQLQYLKSLTVTHSRRPVLEKLGLVVPWLKNLTMNSSAINGDCQLYKEFVDLESIELTSDFLPCRLFDGSVNFTKFKSFSMDNRDEIVSFEDEIFHGDVYFPHITQEIDIKTESVLFDFMHFSNNLTSLSVECSYYRDKIKIPDSVIKLKLKMRLSELKHIRFPSHLEVCDLSDNNLTHIDDSNLIKIESLRWLDLRFNSFV